MYFEKHLARWLTSSSSTVRIGRLMDTIYFLTYNASIYYWNLSRKNQNNRSPFLFSFYSCNCVLVQLNLKSRSSAMEHVI